MLLSDCGQGEPWTLRAGRGRWQERIARSSPKLYFTTQASACKGADLYVAWARLVGMTTLYIDADACPVTREALTIARAQKVPVVMVANATQNLERYASRDGVECVQVSGGRDAADFVIIEMLKAGDVVVTQDIGLAAMVLGRGAEAISVRGKRFHRATIDMELAVRHAEAVHRRAGKRHKGPSPFEDEDREHFSDVLTRVLHEVRDRRDA